VLVGNFNPAIFHPEWFNRFKILPIQEIQWAEGEKPKTRELPFGDKKIIISEVPPIIIEPNRAEIQFLSINLKVKPERYECSTINRDKFPFVKDVTIKTFEILSHTPISAVGINFDGHLKFNDPPNQILKNLFGKRDEDFINILGADYEIGGILYSSSDSLRRTLRMELSKRLDGGIYFNINFHRKIETKMAEQGIEIINQCYDEDLENTVSIVKGLLGDYVEAWKA
jgi:hypothetical protein